MALPLVGRVGEGSWSPTDAIAAGEKSPPGLIHRDHALDQLPGFLFARGMALDARSSTFETLSTKPAELLGIPGGSLRPGAPADVVVIDPDAPWVLDPHELKSKCRNTPFDEARMQGRAVRTIVGGQTVYEYV